ncbi:hypothetical protein F4821DRAFT_231003 [Hypoxylon rubiginosum]|uniref:Uncharacterized protein n=1 Tax=Hypoxylon rubiginosum TaxID=110542 RepID=A0ACC0D9H9_9PEZI|nr:hypothetical protein F4821DRAFT_231003 [Hypoxylon rubiginosum]
MEPPAEDHHEHREFLPTNHPYLRMLKGCYKDVEEDVKEELERQKSQQSLHTIHNALSALGAEYLQWETAVANTQKHYFGNFDVSLQGPSPTQTKENDPIIANLPLQSRCDCCHILIDLTRKYGHFDCEACKKANSAYNICIDCVEAGNKHDSQGHSLRLVKNIEYRFGDAVKIYVGHAHIAELPSQDRPRPEVTIRTVLVEYVSRPQVNAYLVSNGFASLDTKSRATAAVNQWRLICFLLTGKFRSSFLAFLQPIHRAVIRLLMEWWLGEIQDIGLSHLGLNGLFLISMLDMTESEVGIVQGWMRSRYHTELLTLFQVEMGLMTIPYDADRHAQRVASAHHASVQRLAFSYLSDTMRPPWLDQNEDVRINMKSCLWMMFNCLAYPITTCLEKGMKKETDLYVSTMVDACTSTWGLFINNVRSADQLLGPKQLNGSISPCPWFTPDKRVTQYPFYLWDRRRRCTVCTKDLWYLPEYTVVSHTWGRWKKDPKKYPKVDVSGVPWTIPPNDRFDVEDIGNILHSVPGDSPYVWFDLVCIPQTRDGELGNRARQEIAKQAAIFSLAESTIVWFCNLDSFGPLEDLCHLLAVNAIRYPGGGKDACDRYCQRIEKLLEEFRITESSCPLKSQSTDLGSRRWDEFLHEWFSSLWTLQEACMRPDMWLCCSDMKPLISSATGSKIPLDCLLSLVSANADVTGEWQFPSANESLTRFAPPGGNIRASLEYKVYEVAAVNLIQSPPPFVFYFMRSVMAAGLIEIPDITRMSILTLGSQRTCGNKTQRAEAIMSALGVTKWYRPNDGNIQSDEKQLVLGEYPLEFVNELRQEVGDYQFFSHNITRDFWAELDPMHFEDQLLARDDTRGTLLPFASVRSSRGARMRRENVPNIADKTETHGTIAEWLIAKDGSVVMSSAWLLMSSSHPDNINLGSVFLSDYCEVAVNDWAAVTSEQPLHEWISSRSYKCHAVGLQRMLKFHMVFKKQYVRIDGLLLRELKNGKLIKIGTFGTKLVEWNDFGFSSKHNVNWTVL